MEVTRLIHWNTVGSWMWCNFGCMARRDRIRLLIRLLLSRTWHHDEISSAAGSHRLQLHGLMSRREMRNILLNHCGLFDSVCRVSTIRGHFSGHLPDGFPQICTHLSLSTDRVKYICERREEREKEKWTTQVKISIVFFSRARTELKRDFYGFAMNKFVRFLQWSLEDVRKMCWGEEDFSLSRSLACSIASTHGGFSPFLLTQFLQWTWN